VSFPSDDAAAAASVHVVDAVAPVSLLTVARHYPFHRRSTRAPPQLAARFAVDLPRRHGLTGNIDD